MTPSPTVAITGLGLWLPGYPSLAAWSGGTADPAAATPGGRSLDRINRRRASVLDRALADVTAEAMADAAVDPATVPTVIGSSIGEAATMIELLDQMWRHGNPMSPADFTMSVHNAASGLISISNKNRGVAISLAADDDTPAAALIEAIGLVLGDGGPVVVACADEPAPRSLVRHAAPWDMLAAAVVIAPLESMQPYYSRLRVTTGGVPSVAPARVGEALGHNPQIGLVDLVDAVRRRAAGIVALDRGPGRGFGAEIEPGPRLHP